VIFTEKFALLNLLKALENLSPPKSEDGGQPESPSPKSQPAPETPTSEVKEVYPNVMADVLQRHEVIANRVKNKK